MKREALRCFGPDAGQMFELVDQALDRFGEISHEGYSVMESGGLEKQALHALTPQTCHSEKRSDEESLWFFQQPLVEFPPSLGMTTMAACLRNR
jgi:hypothetical protein